MRPLPAQSDEALVDRAQAGDHSAFAELIRRYQPSCMKFALSILRNRDDAEDEVQNACWKAFQHIGSFQKDAKFSTWLTRILLNQCLMRLRQRKRARLFYIDDVTIGEEAGTLDLPASGPTPEEELRRAELEALLHREIRRIPPLLRTVVLLRDVRRLPMPDVAGKLGISVAAAKSRLLRARTELRHRMIKHEPGARLAAMTA